MIFRTLQFALATSILLFSVSSTMSEEFRISPKAVVELFTSQGCSSCPPADELITELGERSDIVALAYHVDYWDYIGWADTFGSPAYSDLQRSYAASWGKPRIYTPQLVINGTTDVVGSRRSEVEHAIGDAVLPLDIALRYADGVLDIGISAHADLPESVIWMVTYRGQSDVNIERGENRGQTITYAQIVTSRQVLGMWDPATGVDLKLPLSDVLGGDSDGVAVVVQQQNHGLPGPILGAALFEM